MEYNYGTVIEYIDGTYDENFNAARKWAYEHNTSFAEDISKRTPFDNEETDQKGLKRYFVIGEEPKEVTPVQPEEHVVTDDELKTLKRLERKNLLEFICDDIERYNNQKAAGIKTTDSEETYMNMLFYAQYLRDFCNQRGKWWKKEITPFQKWVEEIRAEEPKEEETQEETVED